VSGQQSEPQRAAPLLIADGDIATTHIIARLIAEAVATPDVVYPQTLQSARFDGRTIIVSRLCLPELSWLPKYLADRRIPYSYFLDDNFYELTTDYDMHNGAFFSHPAVHATLDKFLTAAERIIVMSPTLARYLEARFPAQHVAQISPPIDLALIDRHRPAQAAAATSRKLRIGYPSTRRPNVAELLAKVVVRTLDRHGDDVEFEFIGWMPDALRGMSGVTFLPEVKGYENYVAAVQLRRWDVALAPMMDSPFENSKTNLKYREYAAFGVPGIYSNVPLYSSCVLHEKTGLLADNSVEAWLAALERTIADPALRASIVEAARSDIEKHYEQPLVAAQLRRCLSGAMTNHYG
jgi:glycosyltransferase involved in cell wall biosynthesis